MITSGDVPEANRSRLSAAWFALALAALGFSALFAVVLVAARTPFLGHGAAWFRTALVLHVNLAVTVWFLAAAAGIWSLAAGKGGWLRWSAFAASLAGTLAMLVTPLVGRAPPILSNYTPLLDHSLFVGGLVLFGAGAAVTGLCALFESGQKEKCVWRTPAKLAVLALLAAVAVFLLDILHAPAAPARAVSIDDLMWGGGHSLQFVHVLLLMAAWRALGDEALARVAGLRALVPWCFFLALLPIVAGPVISLVHQAGTVESRALFTSVMRWGTWPGAAMFVFVMAAGFLRLRRERKLTEDEHALLLSLALFATGCVLGANIRGDSLMVPAHYHATVGAVTLAYLVWMRQLAASLGVAAPGLLPTRKLPLLYGAGILVLVAGLAAGGSLGVPRKAPHIDLSLDNASYLAAMGTAGVGGFVALAAVAAMVFLGFRAAYRSRSAGKGRRKDVRAWGIAATVLLVLLGGWLLEQWPTGSPVASPTKQSPVSEATRADIDLRFQQGVVMLHAKQYEHALTSFNYVLQLAPKMPEVHVNIGYALLGLKRFAEAHDSFENATRLRSSQLNAYYGLAVALEGLGDLAGALGAMQTYVHLTKPDDPYRVKAEAALWEWREDLRLKSEQKAPAK